MQERQFEFEWNHVKAASNLRKHGIAFELASSVFHDPRLLTVADVDHSDIEERWLSVGCAGNGAVLSIAYLLSDTAATMKIRLISARKATTEEISQYQETS